MKLKHTQKKSARRGPSITSNHLYAMSVAERRKMGIHAADAAEYDEKHGIATASPSRSKLRRAFSRRQS
jgi:hypothetical protein